VKGSGTIDPTGPPSSNLYELSVYWKPTGPWTFKWKSGPNNPTSSDRESGGPIAASGPFAAETILVNPVGTSTYVDANAHPLCNRSSCFFRFAGPTSAVTDPDHAAFVIRP
jgi:hypothetical protein